MNRAYSVKGRWPFPTDMLRHDTARATTRADQVLIDRMSGESSDVEFGTHVEVTINLTMEAGGPTRFRPDGTLLPNRRRWESFGWSVVGSEAPEKVRIVPISDQIEQAIRRELERWDGVDGLSDVATQIASHLTKRVTETLARNHISLSQ